MKRPRVLLAADHAMVAEGLKGLLSEAFDVVEVVNNGRAMIGAARRLRPDVIVADISMPELNGLDALARLRREGSDAKVIFLTMHENAAYARRAFEVGAAGFVVKHAAPEELIAAIHAVHDGKTFITPALAGGLLREVARGSADHKQGASLTSRQREILQLLAEGRSAKQIANSLAISVRTVEFHKYQMMEVHGIHSTAELVHFAIKHGIVTI
jgi:DNA-binding NarL/FixJ family response regulator